MKRTVIAAAWLVGATVPATFAAVFLFGCCVLPFHHALHRVMPLCHMATGILQGHHADDDRDHHPIPPASPKRTIAGPQVLTNLTPKHSASRTLTFAAARDAAQSETAYRNFLTLGAARCDQDVGLRRQLIETYRI